MNDILLEGWNKGISGREVTDLLFKECKCDPPNLAKYINQKVYYFDLSRMYVGVLKGFVFCSLKDGKSCSKCKGKVIIRRPDQREEVRCLTYIHTDHPAVFPAKHPIVQTLCLLKSIGRL